MNLPLPLTDPARPPWYGALVDLAAIAAMVTLAAIGALPGTMAFSGIVMVSSGRLLGIVMRYAGRGGSGAPPLSTPGGAPPGLSRDGSLPEVPPPPPSRSARALARRLPPWMASGLLTLVVGLWLVPRWFHDLVLRHGPR